MAVVVPPKNPPSKPRKFPRVGRKKKEGGQENQSSLLLNAVVTSHYTGKRKKKSTIPATIPLMIFVQRIASSYNPKVSFRRIVRMRILVRMVMAKSKTMLSAEAYPMSQPNEIPTL